MKNRLFITLLAAFCAGLFLSARAQETRKIYLSGTGFGNTVKWNFYCTEGRNSGKWKKIEVPSQWELQGFGEYTYGRWYKDKDRNRAFTAILFLFPQPIRASRSLWYSTV